MSDFDNKYESSCDKEENNEEKKGEKEDATPALKTTTETATFFFLSKFNPKEISCEERQPKNFKDLECLLNKILLSLEETENVFLNQAKEVMDRDLVLISWRLRLKHLHRSLKEKKQDFERVDQTVQCICKLSSHIENILCKLEKELPGDTLVHNAFKFSPGRMCMYDKMLKVNITQRDIIQQISNAVILINEAFDSNPLDPVEQFTKILSLHMEILTTIEDRTIQLEEQLNVIMALLKYYNHTKRSMVCYYL